MWWKRLKKRQRFARKRNLTYLPFLFILLSMGIGYTVLNTTLGIDGTSLYGQSILKSRVPAFFIVWYDEKWYNKNERWIDEWEI